MWMYIVLPLVGLLILLGILPVVFTLQYDRQLTVKLHYAFITVPLLPRPTSKADSPKKKKKKKQNQPSSGRFRNMTEQYGVLGAVEQLISAFGSLSKGALRLIRGARVRNFHLVIRVAGEDAAKAAITYGQVCSVLYPFLGVVDKHMKLIRPDLDLTCDYTAENSEIRGQAKVYISPHQILGSGFYLLKELTIKNLKRKGGFHNERK